MTRGRDELAELLFAGMPDEQFDGFVGGLGEVLIRLRAALGRVPPGAERREDGAR